MSPLCLKVAATIFLQQKVAEVDKKSLLRLIVAASSQSHSQGEKNTHLI